MADISYLSLLYEDFQMLQVIDPDKFDKNFADIKSKVNEMVTALNTDVNALTTHKSSSDHDGRYYTETETNTLLTSQYNTLNEFINTHKTSTDHDSRYYTESEIDVKTNNLQTQINNDIASLVAHKSSNDHDNKYYTKILLDGGQLDNRYYTETELNNGQLDSRYFTETEITNLLTLKANDNIVVKTSGNQSIDGIKTFTSSPIVPTPSSDMQVSTKKYVDDTATGVVLGQIPNNSLTNDKLTVDVKVGSLSTLDNLLNGFKSSITSAINKTVSWIGNITLLNTTDKTSVVGAINELFNNKLNKTEKASDTILFDGKPSSNFITINGTIATSTITPTTQVLSVTDSTEGIADVEIGGETLYNAITNGDFANGTTGWSTSGSTISVANKILTVTGNGASTLAAAAKLLTLNGAKRFYRVRARVTNSLCTRIELRDTNGVMITFLNSPVANVWYDLFLVGTPPTEQILIGHRYADSATANGKVMEVDGNIGVFAIPLNPPYDTYTADQINYMVNVYWEGFKASNALTIKSAAVNLINKDDFMAKMITQATTTYASRVVEEGRDCLKFVGNSAYVNKLLGYKFKANTQYTMKLSTKYATSIGGILALSYTDGTVTTVPANVTTFTSFTVTSTAGKTIKDILITYGNNGGVTYIDLDTIMLNEGSTALPYEPYRGRTLSLSGLSIHRLPNNVQDWVIQKYGRTWAVRNVQYYTLVSANVTAITNGTNSQRATIPLSNLVGIKSQVASTVDNSITFGGLYKEVANLDTSGETYTFVTDTTNLYIQVPLGTWVDLATAQSALNNIKLAYQLTTPQYIDYTDFDANGITLSGDISTFEDYTNLAMTSSDLTPSPKVTYQCNVKTAVLSLKENVLNNSELLQKHEVRLDNIVSGTQKVGDSELLDGIDSTGYTKYNQTISTITTGFASGWSGTITAIKNHNNLVELTLDLLSASDISFANVYTLSTNLRPVMGSNGSLFGLDSGGLLVPGAVLDVSVNTDGTILIFNATPSVSGIKRVYNYKIMYYTA